MARQIEEAIRSAGERMKQACTPTRSRQFGSGCSLGARVLKVYVGKTEASDDDTTKSVLKH